MAIVNSLNVAGLLAFASKYAPEIIKSLLQEVEVIKHFGLDSDISSSKRYPKMSIGDVLAAYDGADDNDGGEITLSDRELRVSVGKAVLAIDSESVRHTFLNKTSKVTNGKVDYEEAFLTYFIQKILAQFNNETFWKGDTTLANTTPNRSKRVMDGLEKDLLAAITATTIVPVTTVAFSAGTGFLSSAVDGNTIQGVTAVWDALKPPYKMLPTDGFLSDSVFTKMVEQYNRRTQQISFLDPSQSSFVMPNSGGMLTINKAFWLGTSQRVIVANKGAIRLGSDTATMLSELKVQEVGYKMKYLSKIVAGLRIIDTEAVSCNNLA